MYVKSKQAGTNIRNSRQQVFYRKLICLLRCNLLFLLLLHGCCLLAVFPGCACNGGAAFKFISMNKEANKFMRKAIRISVANVEKQKGGPFGAIVVKDGRIIARGSNQVTSSNDPTAHAEIVAIRKACKALKTFQLTGCEIYTSCEPCPMCLGAIYWARPDKLFYASSKEDAAAINFDDKFIYEEIAKPVEERKLFTKQVLREKALEAFEKWKISPNKIEY